MAAFFQEYNQCESPLTEFPEKYYSLLCKMIQDHSGTESELSRFVLKYLSPTPLKDQKDHLINSQVVLEAINKIATRVNYGIQVNGEDFKHLSIWRWEVRDEYTSFPDELNESLKERRDRRVKAKEELMNDFNSQSQEKKTELTILSSVSKKRKMDVDSEAQEIKEAKESEKQRLKELKEAEKEEKRLEKEKKEAEKEERRLEKEKKEQEKRQQKEDLETAKRKREQSQKKIQGFFKILPKDEKIVPVENKVSDYKRDFQEFFARENVSLTSKSRQFPFSDSLWDSQSEDIVKESFKNLIMNNKKMHKSSMKQMSEGIEVVKFKLLQFYEDVRPPYFGSWCKYSLIISGKRPFSQDTLYLDYENDSEAEWEEDEPGEELNSEDDMDESSSLVDDVDEDDGWVVPHGYLSDDEGIEADHFKKPEKSDMKEAPKRALLEPLCPLVYGTFRIGVNDSKDAGFSLSFPIVVFECKNQIDPFEVIVPDVVLETEKKSTRKAVFPEELTQDLYKGMLGSSIAIPKITEEFQQKNPSVKKATIEQKIKDSCIKEKRGTDSKPIWYLRE